VFGVDGIWLVMADVAQDELTVTRVVGVHTAHFGERVRESVVHADRSTSHRRQ
jgi:hypothetical protein